jgi:hypothetical protein
MIRLKKPVVIGLFVILALSREAISQAPASGQVTIQMDNRKAEKPGNLSGSRRTGAIPRESSWLCFQAGMGWQRVPPGQVSAPVTPGSASSSRIGTEGSTTAGNSHRSSAKPTKPADCPEMLTNTVARGAGIENVSAHNQAQAITFPHSTGINAGTRTSPQVNSAVHPASGAASSRLMMGMSAMPSIGTFPLSGTTPGGSSEQMGDLESHAYVSSIKLRRSIRTAPDLQTRIRLEALQNKLVVTSHASMGNSKGNRATKKPLNNRHGNSANSSLTSEVRERATESTRALPSHTNR